MLRKGFLRSFLLFLTSTAFAAPLTQQDFGYGMPVQVSQANAPFYRLAIPFDVYAKSVGENLSDVRVIDSQGHFMPMGLEHSLPLEKQSKMNLPTIPVLRGIKTLEQLQLNVTRSKTDEIIAVASPEGANQYLTGYLVDTRRIQNQWIDGLHITWSAPGKTSEVQPIAIATSDDLQHWSLLNVSFKAFNLHENNFSVSGGDANLNQINTQYLFIFTPGKTMDVRIAKLSTRLLNRPLSQTTWVKTSLSEVSDKEYQFENAYHLPLEAVLIRFPAPAIARIELRSRNNPILQWEKRRELVAFSLQNGKDTFNNPLTMLYNVNDRFWSLRVMAGFTSTAPHEIFMAWQPQHLLFVPKGQPPYTLLFGSAKAPQISVSTEELLAEFNQGNPLQLQDNATLGKMVLISGEKARQINTGFSWGFWIKKIILVLFLLAVIGFFSGLVFFPEKMKALFKSFKNKK